MTRRHAGASMRVPERGAALVAALFCTLIVSALGAALVLTSSTESLIADNFRKSTEALYAADGVLQQAVADLAAAADWDGVLGGSSRSSFADGTPAGVRTLADGTRLDLTQVLNRANCGQASSCSAADMDAVSADRPWGANNPRWQLYAYGPLGNLLHAGGADPPYAASPYFAIALVADDGAENDDDPTHDGVDAGNPGAGVILVRAEAFGARGAHRAIEATVAHNTVPGRAAVRVLSWREVR